MKNTLLNYTPRTIQTYSVPDYFSTDIVKIKLFLTTQVNNFYDWHMVQDNDTWERLSLELYNSEDLWDLLFLMNSNNPLMGLSYDFDTLVNLSEDKVLEYEINTGLSVPALDTNNIAVPNSERDLMATQYRSALINTNDQNRVLKIIKPARINELLQLGYDQGIL